MSRGRIADMGVYESTELLLEKLLRVSLEAIIRADAWLMQLRVAHSSAV
jgi:hypothetical protein